MPLDNHLYLKKLNNLLYIFPDKLKLMILLLNLTLSKTDIPVEATKEGLLSKKFIFLIKKFLDLRSSAACQIKYLLFAFCKTKL